MAYISPNTDSLPPDKQGKEGEITIAFIFYYKLPDYLMLDIFTDRASCNGVTRFDRILANVWYLESCKRICSYDCKRKALECR